VKVNDKQQQETDRVIQCSIEHCIHTCVPKLCPAYYGGDSQDHVCCPASNCARRSCAKCHVHRHERAFLASLIVIVCYWDQAGKTIRDPLWGLVRTRRWGAR